MAKLLLIEDEASIRRLLRYDLRNMEFEVESASSAEEAWKLIQDLNFEVLVVDWMLPKMSGLELVEKYREAGKDGIVIMLTAKDNEEDILDAFEAGVDDYVTKPFSPRELTARISAHLKRYVSKDDRRKMVYNNTRFDLDMHRVYINEEEVDLTKKEFDLMLYLVRHINVVLSRDQILNEIWNFDYDGDTRIVDVHVHKVRAKMEASDITIQSLRGVGYVAKTK